MAMVNDIMTHPERLMRYGRQRRGVIEADEVREKRKEWRTMGVRRTEEVIID
jgi:hypothetical protein